MSRNSSCGFDSHLRYVQHWGISSADRALRLHRRGQRFESVILHNCNDSEMNDGTDAMYEMETFETRIKEWMRHKPYRHYKTYMPVWRNKQCMLTSNIETYLIRSGGVTEKDPVKLINTFHRHLIWKTMIRCASSHLKLPISVFQNGPIAHSVRANDS